MKIVYRISSGEILTTQEGKLPDHVLLKNAVDSYKGTRADYGVLTGPDELHDDLQVARGRKVVNGELVLDKAPDHLERLQAWRQQKQSLIAHAVSVLRSRSEPATGWIEERLAPISNAWYEALADPRRFEDHELAQFHGRLGPVHEKLRALAYHRGHLERYRNEAHRVLRSLAPLAQGVGAIDSSACVFEFQAFLFQARAVFEVFFRAFEPLTRQVTIKRRPAVKVLDAAAKRRRGCGEAADLLRAAAWVDEWEDDQKKPGSLRRAIVHYGSLRIAPLQIVNNETRLMAVHGLTQDNVDLLEFVDMEIERITTLVVSVSIVLLGSVKDAERESGPE